MIHPNPKKDSAGNYIRGGEFSTLSNSKEEWREEAEAEALD